MKRKKTGLFALLFLLFYMPAYSVTFPRDTTYTTYQAWSKIVRNYPQARIVPEKLNSTIKAYTNQVYADSGANADLRRPLHVDVYTPAAKGKYPVLLMIHGGGWRSGHKEMERPMAQRIAAQGYVTIAVEYRLSPEAKYPAAVHDIKAAIRWAKCHAHQYQIDTARVAIEGNSAGGQLATLVGMTGHDPAFEGTVGTTKGATSVVQAVIDIDGVVDFLSPASIKIPRKPDAADAFWMSGTFETNPARWKEASPVFHVDEHAVPVLFICSAQPRFHAGRDEMIDLLSQFNIYSEKHTLENSPHSFWLLDPWFEPTFSYMVGFLDKIFHYKH